MYFERVIGHQQIKAQLQNLIQGGRIPHAQLFHGPTGTGTLPMAIAYAQAILCSVYELGSIEEANCAKRVLEGNHPDLHFAYPVNRRTGMSRAAVSTDYLSEWREFIQENPYGSVYQWLQHIGIGNRQGNIGVAEAREINKALSLKSFEGGYKVLILWMPELMHTACANALLKLIEEPPAKSVIILASEDAQQVLGTIRSRCQLIPLPPLNENILSQALVERHTLDAQQASLISKQARGSYTKALEILSEDQIDNKFEEWFIVWVRTAFKARRDKSALLALLDWSDEIAALGREEQKLFINFCSEMFRQAFLLNYKTPELVYYDIQDSGFKLENFAPFIHQNNIFDIYASLEKASYDIERNGNPKAIFSDMSIQLTRHIHKAAK